MCVCLVFRRKGVRYRFDFAEFVQNKMFASTQFFLPEWERRESKWKMWMWWWLRSNNNSSKRWWRRSSRRSRIWHKFQARQKFKIKLDSSGFEFEIVEWSMSKNWFVCSRRVLIFIPLNFELFTPRDMLHKIALRCVWFFLTLSVSRCPLLLLLDTSRRFTTIFILFFPYFEFVATPVFLVVQNWQIINNGIKITIYNGFILQVKLNAKQKQNF